MGMSIDNSIRLLEDYHKWEKKYGIFGSGVDDATNKLLEVAKKYQKIQEIVKRWVDVDLKDSPSIADTNTIEEILEVLENDRN